MSSETDPFSLNVRGVSDLVGSSTNKVHGRGEDSPEGQTGERIDSLSLRTSDAELLKIRDDLEKKYAPHEAKMKTIWQRNMESYLGKKKDGQWLNPTGPLAANLQFEAEETFLAAALSKNPEPVVWGDNSPEGNEIAKSVKTMLQFHADQLVLRRKLTLTVRQWSIYHLGVLKYGWKKVDDQLNGSDIGDVEITNRKIQNFVFDPEGHVDAYGDFNGWLGERIEVSAEKLIDMFPDHKEYINEQVENKAGTKVTYTEWWSGDDTFTFYTFKKKVLDKHKNQYFNYPEPTTNPVTGGPEIEPESEDVGPDGEVMFGTGKPVMRPGINHFAQPKKPYTFLSVFSMQEQPHDVTGLIEQNIANQKKIADRSEQINYNVSASNNGYAYSEENFNQETAKQAAEARKKGNPILIPSGGPIGNAILPLAAQDLPSGIFNELEITKNDLRQSWGIQGITSQPADEDQTARGMILNQAHDTSRIGGGIGDAIEQVADSAFNWLTQLYAVFYDEEHFAAVMGNAKAVEYITLKNSDLKTQLIVSVSPDSLKPKDETTEINLAQALFDKGAIGPKTLLKILDFPDPDDSAADGVLYKMDPMAYMQLNFPEVLQQMQQAQMQQQQQAMAGMAPGGGGMPPEQVTEPQQGIARDPASAALSEVQLPDLPQGGPAG
jgi:hypothetical protein